MRCAWVVIGSLLLGGCAAQRSDRALLEGLSLRENQVASVWRGATGARHVAAEDTWVGGHEDLVYLRSPNTRVFYDLTRRVQEDPRFVLPALGSNDPEVVLTTLYLLEAWNPRLGGAGADAMVAEVADALHRHCFGSADVRIRWKADQLLFPNYRSTLSVADFDAVISDPEQSIRDLSPEFAAAAFWNLPTHDAAALREQKSALIDVLVKHLSDEDWVTRQVAAASLRDDERLRTGTTDRQAWAVATRDIPRIPQTPVAYAQADWTTRQATHKAWQEWWQAHREDVIGCN